MASTFVSITTSAYTCVMWRLVWKLTFFVIPASAAIFLRHLLHTPNIVSSNTFWLGLHPFRSGNHAKPIGLEGLLPVCLLSVLLRSWGFLHIRTLRLIRACTFPSPYRRGGRGAYPQGKHPHQSCHGGQEEGGDDRNKGKTVVDARATIVWDGTSTRVFSETL